MSHAHPSQSGSAELSYDEFAQLAKRVGAPAQLWDDLYPMVRDLRALADQINELTPALHEEIPVTALRSGMGD
jgi:hypothetical protein